MNKKILPALGLLLLLAGILSGCSSSSIRATNWTDLTVDNGVVYAADLQHVVALNAETGEQIWIYPRDGESLREIFYNVALFDGTVLAVSFEPGGGLPPRPPNGVLRALSAADGQTVWADRVARSGDFAAAGAASDGLLVIGNSNGQVYAFRTQTGAEAWSFTTGGRVWASPLILDSAVYVASLDHKLYAIDLQTGQQRWVFQADGAILAPPLALDGRLYIGAFDNRVYALHQEDGTPAWPAPFEGEGWFWAQPSTDGTTIYAVDVNGVVYALDAESGAPRWEVPARLEEPVRLKPLLSADNSFLLVGSDLGTLFALDAADGHLLWSIQGGGKQGQLASLVIHDDVVYLTRLYSEHSVEALRVSREGGETLWQYPPVQSE